MTASDVVDPNTGEVFVEANRGADRKTSFATCIDAGVATISGVLPRAR